MTLWGASRESCAPFFLAQSDHLGPRANQARAPGRTKHDDPRRHRRNRLENMGNYGVAARRDRPTQRGSDFAKIATRTGPVGLAEATMIFYDSVLHRTSRSVYWRVFVVLERNASVAQLAEQLICNQQVVGSSPSASSWSGSGRSDRKERV